MANKILQKISRGKDAIEWNGMECKAYGSILLWINHIEIKVNDKNYGLCELYEFFIFIELILSSVSKFYRCCCCCCRHYVITHIFLPVAQYTFFAWLSLLFAPPIFSQLNLVRFFFAFNAVLNFFRAFPLYCVALLLLLALLVFLSSLC